MRKANSNKRVESKQSTPENDFLSAALAYAKSGFRVLPVTPDEKEPPLISKWPKRATTDQKRLKGWWKKWPQANVAIATGVQSGVLVVDVDRHGIDGFATLEELVTEHGELPATPTALTPNRGKHFFFRVTKEFKGGRAVLGAGIDIRAEGGYVIAAPSVVKGGIYVWAD